MSSSFNSFSPRRSLSLCGVLAALSLLSACAASPELAAQTPERVHASPADYAGNDCDMLERFLPVMQRGYRITAGFQHTVYGWHVSAIEQVQREKGCAEQRAAAATAKAAGSGQLSVALEPVTPAIARMLGMATTGGALVAMAATPEGASAGLQARDVIVEIAGQRVQTPSELRAIVGLMAPGYRPPLRVWRDGSLIDTTVEVTAPQATAVAARR